MTLSRWCAAGTIEVDVLREDFKTWDTVPMSGHKWCHGERWHDEYHGKDPGCCAGPEERESWACECDCHAERRVALIDGIMDEELPRFAEALKRLGASAGPLSNILAGIGDISRDERTSAWRGDHQLLLAQDPEGTPHSS